LTVLRGLRLRAGKAVHIDERVLARQGRVDRPVHVDGPLEVAARSRPPAGDT
jgi:hypothetical protein